VEDYGKWKGRSAIISGYAKPLSLASVEAGWGGGIDTGCGKLSKKGARADWAGKKEGLSGAGSRLRLGQIENPRKRNGFSGRWRAHLVGGFSKISAT